MRTRIRVPGQQNAADAMNEVPVRLNRNVHKVCVYSCASLAALIMSPGLAAASFDEQRAAVSAAIETQTESAIISLLQAGIEEGKPTQAIAETRKWLRQNLPEDAMLLYHAGRAAELSGDAAGAAALYQQYLLKAEPKSETVGLTVVAVHALLRDQLNDPGAAYSFNRNVGDRLAANPISRQFDQWFFEEAKRRQDVVAVAKRLSANIKAGIPVDLLQTHYADHFRWLLSEIDGYIERGRQPEMTEETISAYRQLSDTMSFDEEMALKLNWAVAVRTYNLAKVAGEDVPAPIAEAQALLEKYPHYAKWVQDGWAGGGNGPHYRNDTRKYWPHETEAKMAPIVAAAAKLTPLRIAELLKSWQNGYYGDRYVRPLELKSVQDFVKADPKRTNSRHGLILLDKEWNKLTPEEAQAIAPELKDNAQPEVSYICAIAAGGPEKNLDKMIAALLGPEAWRLGTAELDGRYADQLWHYAGRPGGNATRDQKIRESKTVADKIRGTAVKKEASVKQRLDRFRQLWSDYMSAQPKIPGVLSQLKSLINNTPETIPELLKDQSLEAQLLARESLASGFRSEDEVWKAIESHVGIQVSSYYPVIQYLANRHAGGRLAELKERRPEHYVPHPLEPALRQAVQEGLNRKSLEPWQLIAWLNLQFPEDNTEQLKLMRQVMQSPIWNDMPWEARFGTLEWFRKDVMTPAQVAWIEAANPRLVSAELFSLFEEAPEGADGNKKKKQRKKPRPDGESDPEQAAADITAATAALQSAIDGIQKGPVRLTIPEAAFDNLSKLDPAVFTDAKVRELMLQLMDQEKAAPFANQTAYKFVESVLSEPDPIVLHRAASYIWAFLNSNHRLYGQVRDMIQAQVQENPSAATALANAGLDAFARHRGHSYFNRETDPALFRSMRGNAAMKMGLIVIPVAQNHPAFPIYKSQGDWTVGNEESAWELLDENWEALLPVHRELSLPFLKWVLQRTIFTRNEARQEELIKALLAWAGETGSNLTATEKAEIEIAYGDIALQRGQLRQAHEIYTRTQNSEAYKDLDIRHVAGLRKARAERMAKNFDGALETLTDLELERVPSLWTEIRYARAEVNFDMEEYEDAQDDIESILAREPNHPDAKILLGKVHLRRQKLMEATEVELGSTTSQQSLVPGENLKVTLTDPTLAVSGAGTEIEVVVWTSSGDKEFFFLRQFGDEKTKFRGEVATALGAPSEDDGTLQVIGDDEIYYAYSERFLKKMNQTERRQGGPITVASDGLLMASSRKLLTEAEQRRADMDAVMEQIKADRHQNAEEAARAQLARQALETNGRNTATSYERYLSNVTKPGNPIHIRVIDPDKSRTAEIDELVVSVASSSGDSISRITLKETGTHTGWFEGSVATTGAQALAFARNSEPGRNPNMVISPAADTYPAWRPTPTKNETPEFKIDLNDNLALNELTITATENGAKLTRFALQTGMNERDMTTVAVYPKNLIAIEKPWHPSVTVMNDADRFHNNNDRSVYDLRELQEHMARGWMTQQYAAGVADNVSGPSEAMTEEIPGRVKWLRQNRHHNAHVIYRFRGYFYEPSSVTRRFKVELGDFKIPEKMHPSVAHPPQFLLAVNGRPITDPENPDKLEGEIDLRPGLHSFEIWATGWDGTIGFGRSIELLANLHDPETLISCPDSFFDPGTFPGNSYDHRNSPATITANTDGSEFKVQFAADSRARLLRLVMLEHEGTVPALNKITLTGPDNETILPVAEDFAALNKNDILEILTGDRISVRYQDDRFVTEDKERQERFLDVSFTDARIEFADTDPRFDSRKQSVQPYHEKLLRFKHGEPLSLVVFDADMDSTVNPDSIEVVLQSETGGIRTFTATETGDSTGIFELKFTPVTAKPTNDLQFQVAEGATISATYYDEENNRPGVMTERYASIEHAAYAKPEFAVGHALVSPFEPEPGRSYDNYLNHGFDPLFLQFQNDRQRSSERIRPRWQLESRFLPEDSPPEGGFEAVLGQPLYLELVAPQYALGVASSVEVYAQTDSGRKAAGVTANQNGFDISVPGTIQVSARLPWGRDHRGQHDTPTLNSYYSVNPWPIVDESITDRFHIKIPLVAGTLPSYGYLDREEIEEMSRRNADMRQSAGEMLAQGRALVAKAGEYVHIGFQFTLPDGTKEWATARARVTTHPVFDIMSEDYRTNLTAAYAGEFLNLRVVDLGADTSDEIDQVRVLMQAKSGAKHFVTLNESGPHTGIFRDNILLSYTKAPGATDPDIDPNADGFPVIYGDTVAALYTDPNGVNSDKHLVSVSKGADGMVVPFSKQYEDEEIAMRTQFSLAEAYLEMAKRLRQLGETKEADQKYASAKLLLSKAMDEFTEPDTRAHAEYLLGMLTMEEAIATEEPELRETRFRAALSRFMNVTGTYQLSLHASRAQYRIASIYEQLSEPEIAAQEYVKLAYKYPDSEYLATSMAKLGTHFLKKAAAYEAEAKQFLARAEEDKDAEFEGKALQKVAEQEYLKTASIFGRLQQRFPGDKLAGPAGLRAGQAYMRAQRFSDAVGMFNRVINEESYDGPEVRAQAMYWTGMCHQETRAEMAAYSIFKRLTYDFPESKWAAYARAQLSQERLLRLESELELERLEAGR